jgi:hypothetical protein
MGTTGPPVAAAVVAVASGTIPGPAAASDPTSAAKRAAAEVSPKPSTL